MEDMTLIRAANGAKIAETLVNYGRVEVETPQGVRGNTERCDYFVDDDAFWHGVLAGYQPFGNIRLPMAMLLSEWVARVPGLYWTKSAKHSREKGEEQIESRNRGGITLRPFGKSFMVSEGGVGTLKLPPSEQGDHLITITSSANASAGVPALISAEVWEHHQLGEGAVLEIDTATWQPMSTTWAAQFPSTRGIPRAYLRVDVPAEVHVQARGAATQIHPFSIMRYFDGRAELFDFVFMGVCSTDPYLRNEVEEFFTTYCRAEGRYGEYLIDADIAQPMWNSRFHSPAEVRQADELLQRRIQDAMFGHDLTERLLGRFAALTAGELQHLSETIGIPYATWFRGESQTKEAINFMTRVPREQTAILVDAIRTIHSELVVN